MKLDLIYPIILTPIVFIVGYSYSCISNKVKEIKEAKPYEFEKDKAIENFNETIGFQRQELKKMYRGKAS